MKKTNKLISILLVLAMLLLMAPISVFAATVEASGKFGASGSNLTWSLDSDGVLTVSGSGAMEDFASVSKVPWYSKRTKIKTVVIESGVTNIGKDAFYGISDLVNATISDTVTSIGNRAFSNSGLTNFEFSDAGNLETIRNSAFSSTKIKSMVIPDGVTTLGSYVFGYGPIQSVTIPASVTSVGNFFFEETSDLSEVIFLGNKEPETIGDTVFLGCSSLAYVSVPADYEGDTFSNMKVAKAAASVAEVNGQGFATLADAISAAQSINGAELKLLSHISIDSGITIESGKFTIDLNGKELFSNGYFLLRIDGADVTIVDSAGGGVFNATNDQGNIVLEVLSGSANISGGTFNSAGYPATVKGGTLKLTGKDFVLNGNWRIGWYGGNIDLSACTADEVRIQACADGLQASAITLPDGWGLFKTNGTPCTEFVKNDIYVAKAGFKVTASVNPAEGGTVEGAGTYGSGATVNLTASAANGYRFVNWTQNGEEVSASAVYSFTASGNRELTANFEIIPHTHSFSYFASGDTITAVCANTDGNCPDSEGTLKISAPADLYVDGTVKDATVENKLANTSVAVDVTYSTADGSAPKTAGTYTASVTVGGATASVQFTLINYAAKVTDKDGNELESSPYKTFADAITAASASEGSTVTLLDDITLSSTQYVYSGKFTLDLNGKTITSLVTNAIYISGSAVEIIIDDSGENGKIECTSNDTFSAAIYAYYGTLNIYGGEITNTGTSSPRAVVVDAGSVVNVYGGKLSMQDGYAIRTTGGTANIYGGELSSIKSYAIANDGTTNIYGGKLISKSSFLIYNWDKLNVYGGTLSDNWYTFYNFEGEICVSGGEFTNGLSIYDYEKNLTLNNILAEDYYYKDANGKLITVSDDATKISGYVKVSKGADLSDAVITLDNTEFTYNGGEIRPTVLVTVGGKALAEGKDYTVSFANNVNAGTATVTVTAVADSIYSGEATADFTINKKPVTVTATAPDKVYDGTTDILEYSKVIVKLDGAVEGEMLGFTVGKAWYDTSDAGTDKTVHIIYAPVASNNIDNYEFPMNPEYSTDNCYVAAKADITKKAVTANANAPDKQYNGVNDIDKSKITVILDGIVDGESVETTVETAWIEGESVGENYLVPVFFSVSGDAAKNYIFPINELYPTEFYYAEATVNIYNDFTPKKGTEYNVNSNDWINTDFVVTANKGYLLSLSNEVNGWSDTLSKSEETENGSIMFYVKNKETGAISIAVTENYKIDKTMPHGYFSDSHGRGYEYLLLDEIQTEPYYENEDIFTHKYEAWDDASGIANMEYYFSITKLTKSELDSVSGWTEFELDIDIEDIFEFPGDETYSYIRVTDKAGNTIYYVAHLVYDGEMAKINGVLDGFTYYTTQIISVTDNFKLDYVTVNGEVIKSGYDTITLAGNCDATYEIFAYDLAGNPRDEAIIIMKPIATLSEYIDNLKEETLKSSDKETIEAVKAKVEKIDTTDATKEEKAELQKIIDKCDALLKKIAETQAEIDRIEEAVGGYTEETVKSTDSDELSQLKEDIQSLIDSDNVTENEKTVLEDMITDIEGLEEKITETEEKLEEIKGIENNFNPENVSSDDKAAIEDKIAEIEKVNPDNLTDEQKAEYEEIKAGFEALLEEIAAAEKDVADIGAQLEMFDEKRVTIFWEDDIEALKAKIDELLADENMGEAEKAKLNEYKAQCDNLIEIINTPKEYFSLRLFYFIWDCLTWKYNGILRLFSKIFG